jgi:hypothetical protein
MPLGFTRSMPIISKGWEKERSSSTLFFLGSRMFSEGITIPKWARASPVMQARKSAVAATALIFIGCTPFFTSDIIFEDQKIRSSFFRQ